MKKFLYILLVIVVHFVSILAMGIMALVGKGEFYVPLIWICALLFLVFTFLHLFHVVSSIKMKRIWLIFVSLIVFSCITYEIINASINAYDRSFIRVREGDIDLSLYAPFAENTRAVVLDTLSTLTFETDLPVLDGATALYPVYSAFVQAVYPKQNYDINNSEVLCTNTIHAYENLIDKMVDIIFVAPPSEEQLEMAQDAHVSFNYTPIGREAFVFFVNSQNPVDNLTLEQMQGIYSGDITNWKELGGRNDEIRPFQRNLNSGSQTAFVHFMQGKTIMSPPLDDVVWNMSAPVSRAADYVNYGNSIGYSFRFYVSEMINNEKVKMLKINGIYPDLETTGNGTYPLSSSFYAISLTDNDKPNVTKFLEWIVSRQGQYLVSKTGYSPIIQTEKFNNN